LRYRSGMFMSTSTGSSVVTKFKDTMASAESGEITTEAVGQSTFESALVITCLSLLCARFSV
jgi:hypothetical protein